MTTFSPREIVSELDRYIVGQNDAKRAVAIALRNRWRRQQLEGPLKDEVAPKNILMIGPTGCGKTEISRAWRSWRGALPQGRGDEVHRGRLCRARCREHRARSRRGRHLAGARGPPQGGRGARRTGGRGARARCAGRPHRQPDDRDSFRRKLRAGELDEKEIEVELSGSASPFPAFEMPNMPGQMSAINLSDLFGKAMGGRGKPAA